MPTKTTLSNNESLDPTKAALAAYPGYWPRNPPHDRDLLLLVHGRVWREMRNWVDPQRSNLAGVVVVDGILVATDGHKMVAWGPAVDRDMGLDVAKPSRPISALERAGGQASIPWDCLGTVRVTDMVEVWGPAGSLDNPRSRLVRLGTAAGDRPLEYTIKGDGAVAAPSFDRVARGHALGEPGEYAPAVMLDGAYLAHLSSFAKAARKAAGYDGPTKVLAWASPTRRDPVCFTGLDWFAVIMPIVY